MKSIKNSHHQSSIHLILIAIISVVLIGSVGYLFWNNYSRANNSSDQSTDKQKLRLTDDKTSNRNIALMDQAVTLRDEKKCDEINGAINYTNPNEKNANSKLSAGVSIVTSAMTESEAKESCRNHVHKLIDQKNYENKVCADKSTTHYMFNNVRWPCPED